MHILIIYGSLEGQTRTISERIAGLIRHQGHQVTTLSGEQLPAEFAVEKFDAAVIGGAIHMGRFPKYIEKFVTTHRDWLNAVPSAFFTVCMAIRSQKPESREEAMSYSGNFLDQTGWHPMLSTTFAGAVKYTQYNFMTRYIMKMISKREGGSTDTSRDHEYTDWEAVARFAEAFMDGMTEKREIEESL